MGEHELELVDRAPEIAEREHWRGEDAVLVVEAPVVVEPAVECMEVRVQLLGIVLHEVLDAHSERGEQQDALDALAVHEREPCVAVDVLGLHRLYDRALRDAA